MNKKLLRYTSNPELIYDAIKCDGNKGYADLDILTNFLKIKVNYNPHFSNFLLLGSIHETNGEVRIWINKSFPEEDQRFTLAHEIGHFYKHRDILSKSGFTDKIITLNKDLINENGCAMELEADDFAKKLLMPSEVIEDRINSLLQYKKNNKIKVDDFIVELSEYFFVSVSEMMERMRDLNYPIHQITLKDMVNGY